MQEKEMRLVIRQTVKEALIELGVDVEDANEMQADMHFLRQQRKGSEQIGIAAKKSAVGAGFLAIPGILWLIWEGLKNH